MSDEGQRPPEIKVTDRRSFAPDGTRRADGSDAPVAGAAHERSAPEVATHEASRDPQPANGLPGVDFAQIVISFRTSALLDLGLLKDPSIPEGPLRLDGARQMIDILVLLRDKTRGNLSADEGELLEQVIEELQLHWVRVSQAAAR